MLKISFSKYHGAGNDFIIIDRRMGSPELNREQIAYLCHRQFGIGADGLMYLLSSEKADFEMKYYNADGGEGTMCGNGGRCIAAYAFGNKLIPEFTRFMTIDGLHEARILENNGHRFNIKVSLNNVSKIKQLDHSVLIDTGSPHYVTFVENLNIIDVLKEGRKIRWDNRFMPDGVNVNFVQQNGQDLTVRTFERGVENITLSCGTGVTASAVAAALKMNDGPYKFHISTYGGELEVDFKKQQDRFTSVTLKGPVIHVFNGEIGLYE